MTWCLFLQDLSSLLFGFWRLYSPLVYFLYTGEPESASGLCLVSVACPCCANAAICTHEQELTRTHAVCLPACLSVPHPLCALHLTPSLCSSPAPGLPSPSPCAPFPHAHPQGVQSKIGASRPRLGSSVLPGLRLGRAHEMFC